MRLAVGLLLILVGFGAASASRGVATANAAVHHATLLDIDDIIMPATARFLSRGIDKATEDGAQFVIVRIDTPGGLVTATEDIVKSILAADLPVVAYVAPRGAHAASAGTFITAAAHVAAMAPATNIGAATPISAAGGDLDAKVSEDAAASLRKIAEERGRNSEALEKTVLEAKSYTANEALENNIIDLIARDMDELLTLLDGRTVQINESTSTTLRTSGLEVRDIERTVLERFLGILADPNIAFGLMVIGGILLVIEVLAGFALGVPGIVGGIMLALALLALGSLPVNYVGVGLIVLAFMLFFIELQAPGISVPGTLGAAVFILGSLLLFGGFTLPGLPSEPPSIDAPSIRVNPWLIAGLSAGGFAFFVFVVRDMVAARRRTTADATSAPLRVGETAVVATDLSPTGTVHAGGEDWTAVSDSGETIKQGEEVIVSEIQGLTLEVFRASEVERQLEEGNENSEPAS